MKFFMQYKKRVVLKQFDYDTFCSEHIAIQSELDSLASRCYKQEAEASFRKTMLFTSGCLCLFLGSLFFIINMLRDIPIDLGIILLLICGVVVFLAMIIESLITKSKNKLNFYPLRLVALLNRDGPNASENALSFVVAGPLGMLAGGIFSESLDMAYFDNDIQHVISIRYPNKTAKWAFGKSSYAIAALTPKKPTLVRLVYKSNEVK